MELTAKIENILTTIYDFVSKLFKVIGDFFNSFKPSEEEE